VRVFILTVFVTLAVNVLPPVIHGNVADGLLATEDAVPLIAPPAEGPPKEGPKGPPREGLPQEHDVCQQDNPCNRGVK
jgi:hypothetical protein